MKVVCPKCLTESAVTVDVTDGETLACPKCDETYTTDDVEAVIESWQRVLPWLRAHPARTEAAAEVTTATS